MPNEPQKNNDGCTIVLHPNNDGTYHWMCPNCKTEDLGLSAETNLADYIPNVTCPSCGFQYGVDKRYLNESLSSASYICGECLHIQRFDKACGNCGASAMRHASTPVPLQSNQQPDLVTEARDLLRQLPASKYVVPEKDSAERVHCLILTMGFTAGVIPSVQVTPFIVGFVPVAQAFARAPELIRQLANEVEALRRREFICSRCYLRKDAERGESEPRF